MTFFDGRKSIHAKDLTGPRVYSTDLHPGNFRAEELSEHLLQAARALKVKILTKGVVAVHSSHLLSPAVVYFLQSFPDLFKSDALLPAFRVDKESLDDYRAGHRGAYDAYGIGGSAVDEHVARLNEAIVQAMPWDLGDVSERYRGMLMRGLEDERSAIRTQLDASNAIAPSQVKALIEDIRSMNLDEEGVMHAYVGKMDISMRPIFSRFEVACYHIVGTGVVNCETGTDLSPLSRFKAVDFMTYEDDRRSVELSDDTIFLEIFFAQALGALQSMAVPTAVVDAMSFSDVGSISAILREAKFQERYEELIVGFAKSLGSADGIALEEIDPGAIGAIVESLKSEFDKEIRKELGDFAAARRIEANDEALQSLQDVVLSGAGVVPVAGNFIAVYDVVKNYRRFLAKSNEAAGLNIEDPAAMLAAIRDLKIRKYLDSHPISNETKAAFLEASKLLADLHSLKVSGA